MVNRKGKKQSSERETWYKLFQASVNLIKTQKEQLQELIQDRHILENMIQLQNQRREYELHLAKTQFFQMKEKLIVQEMELEVAAAKTDSLLGMTKREASCSRYMLENADGELAAFREYFDKLSQETSKDTLKIDNGKDGDNRGKALLVSEVKKLKSENEKLSLEKNTEVSALLAEKKFIWNQYNQMESSFKDKLQEKSSELENANQKIQMLSKSMEELQSSNAEKDNELAELKKRTEELQSSNAEKDNELVELKRDLAKLKSDSAKKSEDISKLSKEVKSPKGYNRDSTTPLVRCTPLRGKNSAIVTVKSESRSNEKVRSSKRRKTRAATISSASPPKLFTSSFKVPKLKHGCTRSTA